jgi:hypothetical protein
MLYSFQRSREKKDGLKDKEKDSSKDVKKVDKSEKKKEAAVSGQSEDSNKKEKNGNDMKGIKAEEKGDVNDKKLEKNDGAEKSEEIKNVEKKEQGESAVATSGSVKSGKKKIIKKIVKQKVVDKTAGDSASKQNDKLDEKDNGEKIANSEISDQQGKSVAPTRTFVRKKVIRKVPAGKIAQNEDTGDKPKDNSDPSSTAVVEGGTSVKTTVKKKIIKRVAKRKVTGLESSDGASGTKKDADGDEIKAVQAVHETENMERQAAEAENVVSEVKRPEKKTVSKTDSKTVANKKQDDVDSSKTEIKADKDDKKDERKTGEKSGLGSKAEIEADKLKVPQNDGKRGKSKDGDKSKDEKERKDNDGKDESRSKSNKDLKDKKKSEEPPRHPGLILQTKWSKESKLRSLSLSLDSLLDYTDKDMDESTFELSLFAESLYEMLQYQMGSRILTFLQKLRVKFVTKRNQRKRQRDEIHEKEREKKSQAKRPKTTELPVKEEIIKSETLNAVEPDDDKTKAKEEKSVDHVDDVKMEDETDVDEDPEEDPEEDEEMEESSTQHDLPNENKEEEKTDVNAAPEKVAGNEKDEAEDSSKEKPKTAETEPKSDGDMSEKRDAKVDPGKKETSAVLEVFVDKDLLQAFRFFDRNRAGYIRVEDMRLIIHNMRKFLSHRDVKELVQSALLESNTGRDDRILYNKLVRMSGI